MSVGVVDPGLLTTVQDLGRWGSQALGVPVAGPMDPWSHRLANRLVGNDARCATLEVTLAGPVLELPAGVVIAVTGASFDLRLGGRPIETGRAWTLAAAARLEFGPRRAGCRAYLAVAGGLDVPRWLGSRSTDLASGLGGLGGRALRAGDRLEVGRDSRAAPRGAPVGPVFPMPRGGAVLRLLPRRDDDSPLAEQGLLATRFQVAASSNRMGYRLQGPRVGGRAPAGALSVATPQGTVQIPPSGEPILLMADRQTTGGYAAPATVISADLGPAGQLGPGDWVEFEQCDRAAALAALIAHEQAVLRAG